MQHNNGGNFHTYSLDQLDQLCEIAVGLKRALEDSSRREKVSLEESLDGVKIYLEQLEDPKKTKGFTSIPYIFNLVREVKRVYEID